MSESKVIKTTTNAFCNDLWLNSEQINFTSSCCSIYATTATKIDDYDYDLF